MVLLSHTVSVQIRNIVKPRSITQEIPRNLVTSTLNLIFSRKKRGAFISQKFENAGFQWEDLEEPNGIHAE
jgi:hypothetical protein